MTPLRNTDSSLQRAPLNALIAILHEKIMRRAPVESTMVISKRQRQFLTMVMSTPHYVMGKQDAMILADAHLSIDGPRGQSIAG